MVSLKSLLPCVSAIIGLAHAAQLEQVTDFGDNPAGVRMYIYVPDAVGTNPAIVVASHWCTGTASAYYQSTQWATLSEQHNFIVIYPESPYEGSCWDVSSDATLTHDGGGDSNSIANMVAYTIDTYGADASRVFATGSSSGAMMTNVLAATYPDVFKAGSVYAGVPAGCFYTGTVDGWNNTCSSGQVIQSSEAWAAVVHDMYPGYTGEYPKMAIYHGSADTTLYPQNYEETIKQWAGVFGYDTDADETLPDDPEAPFTTYVFGDRLFGALGDGTTHDIPVFEENDLEWFGLV